MCIQNWEKLHSNNFEWHTPCTAICAHLNMHTNTHKVIQMYIRWRNSMDATVYWPHFVSRILWACNDILLYVRESGRAYTRDFGPAARRLLPPIQYSLYICLFFRSLSLSLWLYCIYLVAVSLSISFSLSLFVCVSRFGQFLLCVFHSLYIYMYMYMGFVVDVVVFIVFFSHCLALKFSHCLVENLLRTTLISRRYAIWLFFSFSWFFDVWQIYDYNAII